jgi:hypothetical protein
VRNDVVGLWWDDRPLPAPPKTEQPKRTPPERTWERDDYLPGLQEALDFKVARFNQEELLFAYMKGETLMFDIECYVNFFQIAFISLQTGMVIDFIQTDQYKLDATQVEWVMTHFRIVGFNSMTYDMPMASLACSGATCKELKEASDEIILENARGYDVLRRAKSKALKNVNHIDLIEVAPLRGSLKIYGGRLNVPRMQDLPFQPHRYLTGPQMSIVRWYCVNDLTTTAFLCSALAEQIKLREVLSNETGIDLRSKSDAQIAEAVIADGLFKMNGMRPQKPEIPVGTWYRYKVPAFLQYQTPTMQWVLNLVANAVFVVSEEGNIGMPPELASLQVPIGAALYRMGIGGLHSSESTVRHLADEHTEITDNDVESFYPRIILNLRLFPTHLGPNFLQVYDGIVRRRLDAKRRGDKTVADSLKITINGTFGKLGNRYSVVYAPDLLTQVTLTGQLSLLMLIERLELAGITVVSANTDGIVVKHPRSMRPVKESVFRQWELDTGFKTEETSYKAIYCRDVNNYIAIKTDGGTKAKGVFANPWATEKNKDERLKKNPTNQICIDAVTALLTKHTPIAETIRGCRDITKFISVRSVKGGAVKEGTYLGKSIRWYYSTEATGEIVYALNGNKVPRSDGAKPAMDMPSSFPIDVDFDWYIEETNKILESIAYEM